MHFTTITAVSVALAGFANAWPELPKKPWQIVEQIAPGSVSCKPETLPDCRTAKQAAGYIFHSLDRYGVSELEPMAAVLALMAFESVDFAYKHNVFPGRPGQGTANMQMAPFNLQYAKQIPELADSVANVTSVEGLSDAELNRILGLVTPDRYNFGSGPWFLSSVCGQEVLDGLSANMDEGFNAYMACVGVTVDEGRLAYWTRAKEAFGL
jgi:hypothetical protein